MMRSRIMVTIVTISIFAFVSFGMMAMPQTAYAAGTIYYIDSVNGNDSNSGTSPSQAWKDFNNVNTMTFNPGDQILLNRGDVWNQQLILQGSGNSTDFITLGTYGAGSNPIIDGTGLTSPSVQMNNTSYWNVSDLEMSNGYSGIQLNISALGQQDLNFNNIYAANLQYDPISLNITTTTQPTSTQWAIKNVLIDNVIGYNSHPINFAPPYPFNWPDNTIQNVTVENSSFTKSTGGMGFACAENSLFIDNVFDNTINGYLSSGQTNAFLWRTENVQFINNVIENLSDSSSPDETGFESEAYNDSDKWIGNVFSNNAGAGIEFLQLGTNASPPRGTDDYNTNNVVDGNTFMNDGLGSGKTGTSLWASVASGAKEPTGTLTNNLYSEENGFTNGDFSQFTSSNNTSIPFFSQINNAALGFTSTQGSNNWRYQYFDGSSYSDISTYDSSNQQWGTDGYVSQFDMAPNNVNNAWISRDWVAPSTGIISIRGRVLMNQTGGSGVLVKITKNGTVIWPSNGTPQSLGANDQSGYDTNLDNISVNAGDSIRFEVNNAGSGNTTDDVVSWIPSVAYDTSVANDINLALNKTVSTSTNNGPTYTGAQAVDGNDSTYWCASGGTFPQWLEVDLGGSFILSDIQTDFYASDTWKYKIEGSNDNTTWTTLVDHTSTGVSAQNTNDPVNGTYRYVRITITGTNGNWAAIREFKVNGLPNLALNSTTTTSTNNGSTYTGAQAVDGNYSTYWCASGGTFPQWLELDLGGSFALSDIQTDFYANDTWYYKIEGSNDNTTWTTLVDHTSAGVSAQNTDDPVNGTYRYVRITITGTGGNWAAIREFKVYGS